MKLRPPERGQDWASVTLEFAALFDEVSLLQDQVWAMNLPRVDDDILPRRKP